MRLDALVEVSAIFNRWVRKLVRRPTNLTFSLIQPLIWFLLFTQSFQAVANIPGFEQITGTDSYLTFFSAAVIVQTVLTSALQSGLGMCTMAGMIASRLRTSSRMEGRMFRPLE